MGWFQFDEQQYEYELLVMEQEAGDIDPDYIDYQNQHNGLFVQIRSDLERAYHMTRHAQSEGAYYDEIIVGVSLRNRFVFHNTPHEFSRVYQQGLIDLDIGSQSGDHSYSRDESLTLLKNSHTNTEVHLSEEVSIR